MADDAKDDLIWGVQEIAKEIGRGERQVYHMLSSGALPVARKVGGHWVVPRRRLWAFFNGAEAA